MIRYLVETSTSHRKPSTFAVSKAFDILNNLGLVINRLEWGRVRFGIEPANVRNSYYSRSVIGKLRRGIPNLRNLVPLLAVHGHA